MAEHKIIYSYIKPLVPKDCKLNPNELEKKVIMFVNVTHGAVNSQEIFENLTKLNKLYSKEGLRILAFPCFQFGLKKTREELLEYLKSNRFDIGHIMEEIEVNGQKTCELYIHLKEKMPSPQGFVVTGNFTYFFADRRGKIVQRLSGNATYHELDDIIYQLL